jgi:hypothetical protein
VCDQAYWPENKDQAATGCSSCLHPRRIHSSATASQGKTKLAIDEYKLGLPSDDDGSVHYQLGKLYQRIGNAELADKFFADSKSIKERKQKAARDTYDLEQKTRAPQN